MSHQQSSRKRPNDEMFLSGSTLPKVLAAPQLEEWAITATAEGVVKNIGELAHMCVEAPDVAIARIEQLRWEMSPTGGPLSAAEAGTLVHAVMEAWLDGEPTPDIPPAHWEQVAPFVNNLASWMTEWKPEKVLTEAVVYNRYAMVAGRLDAVVKFRAGPHAGERNWLIDLKTKMKAFTSRGHPQKPHGSAVVPQLTAYKWAESLAPFEPRINTKQGRHYLLSSTEREQLLPFHDYVGPLEELGTAIIQVTPLSTTVFPIECEREQLDWVKALADADRGQRESKDLVLDPIYVGEPS